MKEEPTRPLETNLETLLHAAAGPQARPDRQARQHLWEQLRLEQANLVKDNPPQPETEFPLVVLLTLAVGLIFIAAIVITSLSNAGTTLISGQFSFTILLAAAGLGVNALCIPVACYIIIIKRRNHVHPKNA